ncbi:hypothetical protein ACNAN0_09190 [Agrilactobacillus fermenti]|uniref:hypothetical protein n=1 Tax=Agrilactobacillus fermenti TaxID=2586909 RepID=UPI001E29787A|nr:hypothetical protein [Agrilactobacillus fermenti]MCD2255408.1 hypothetical protein [Agrilactobacillus fermenti]
MPIGASVLTDGASKPIYTDPLTQKYTGSMLSPGITAWHALAYSMDGNGQVIAYQVGQNQWLKVSDLLADAVITPLPFGSVVFSYQAQASLYRDPLLKQQQGKLDQRYNAWAATAVVKNSQGKTLAYKLGQN